MYLLGEIGESILYYGPEAARVSSGNFDSKKNIHVLAVDSGFQQTREPSACLEQISSLV
jgi:hypothetical protein